MVILVNNPVDAPNSSSGWFEVTGSGRTPQRWTVPHTRPFYDHKPKTKHLIPSVQQVVAQNPQFLTGPVHSPNQETRLPARRSGLPKTVAPVEVNLPPYLEVELPFGVHPTPKQPFDYRSNIMVPRAKSVIEQERIDDYVVSTKKNKFSPLNPLTNLERCLFKIEAVPTRRGRRQKPRDESEDSDAPLPSHGSRTTFNLPPYKQAGAPPRIHPARDEEHKDNVLRARSLLSTPPEMRPTSNPDAHWTHERNAKPRRQGPLSFESKTRTVPTPRYLCGIPRPKPTAEGDMMEVIHHSPPGARSGVWQTTTARRPQPI